MECGKTDLLEDGPVTCGKKAGHKSKWHKQIVRAGHGTVTSKIIYKWKAAWNG